MKVKILYRNVRSGDFNVKRTPAAKNQNDRYVVVSYETVLYYLLGLIGQANIFQTNKKKKVVDNEEGNYLKIHDSRVECIALWVFGTFTKFTVSPGRQCMCTAGYESDARKYRESGAISAGPLSRRTRDKFLAIIYTCGPALGNKNNFFSNVCASSRRRTCPQRIFPLAAGESSPRVQLRF